jgi:hypothetical protein
MTQEQTRQPELDFSQPTIRETYGDRVLDSKMVDTSRDVLDALDAEMPETQKAVMEVMDANPIGIGAYQVAEILNKSILSIRPCMTILKRRGLIFDTGRRRTIGKRSKEALMTSSKEHADPALVGSGQLARTSEARVDALLELKDWIVLNNTLKGGWWLREDGKDILAKIDAIVQEIGHE